MCILTRIFSNGPSKRFVINSFDPYFTRCDAIESAARAGKTVHLLIALNASTSPEAVAAV